MKDRALTNAAARGASSAITREAEHLEAIVDNRLLRQSLSDILDIIKGWQGVPNARKQYYEARILDAVNRKIPPGPNRRILANEIMAHHTREDVERSVAAALDVIFAPGGDSHAEVRTHGELVEETQGREGDDDQHRAPAASDRRS